MFTVGYEWVVQNKYLGYVDMCPEILELPSLVS